MTENLDAALAPTTFIDSDTPSIRAFAKVHAARRTGYGRRSIAKWLTFDSPPDRRRAALKLTSPLFFEDFLTQCWKDGNRCGRHLFHDIRRRGYIGSFSNLERLLATWRRSDKAQGQHAARPSGASILPLFRPGAGS